MRRIYIGLSLLLVLIFSCATASAGEKPLIVATIGEGIPVYASATSRKQIGVLYNGYQSVLSLTATNGRHSCALTRETKVWLDTEKAMCYLPEGVEGIGDSNADQVPCNCFLAEVIEDDAKLYSGRGHKRVTATHAKGTLVLVCGSFDKDYYVTGAGNGFMAQSSLHMVQQVDFISSQTPGYGFEGVTTATAFTEGHTLLLGCSATGISEFEALGWLQSGDQVTVLCVLGEWAQIIPVHGYSYPCFVESRFLEPDGDHTVPMVSVSTDHPLTRLNVRTDPDSGSDVVIKLCMGTQVQCVSTANGWSQIALHTDAGIWPVRGYVQSKYLVPGTARWDGTCRVRLLRAHDSSDRRLEAGTEGTVIGVRETNVFAIRLDNGEVCFIRDADEEPLLEPIDPPVWEARTTKQIALREGPNSKSKKIRSLKSGTTVEVLLRGEKWVLVRVNGETGYILNNAIKPKKIK